MILSLKISRINSVKKYSAEKRRQNLQCDFSNRAKLYLDTLILQSILRILATP
jgi:hypothetical protein